MTNADKMFENLGYKKYEGSIPLKYKKDNDNVIRFRENKTWNKGGEDDSYCDYITMPELKAINEKCKELGWLDD